MRKVILFSIILSTFLSCTEGPVYRGKFSEQTCVQEINRSYASVGEAPKPIYKLEEITKEHKIKVSMWHHNSWYYQGKKDQSYFDNTKLFSYYETDCPDGSGSKNVGITKKLKNIDL